MKPVLVISHDAGGAEVVSAWVHEHREFEYSFALAGPAVNVFRRKFGYVPILSNDDVDNGIADASWVLTGTSWGADMEKQAIRSAREKNVRTVSYLDHWTNYAERFELAGERCLPDEIWAGDEHAQRKAMETFPGHPVKLVPNLYFDEMCEHIARIAVPKPPGEKRRVLYVTEPISVVAQKKYGDPRYWGYTEFEALEGYLDYLRPHAGEIARVLLRPHPSEPTTKYSEIITRHSGFFRIDESRGRTLFEDCAWADSIVGCDSMAMVVGVLAGKSVYSCIPKGGRPLSLPFPEIVKLFNN